MKIIKLIGNYLLALFLAIVGVLQITAITLVDMWFSVRSLNFIFAVLLQPIILSITLTIVAPQLDSLFISANKTVFMYILIGLEIIAITLILNCSIELFYHLRGKGDFFAELQEIQKYSNNYALIIISLVALYIAAFSDNSINYNFILLAYGVLFFISMISSDFYKEFIYSKGAVKELSEKILQKLELK